MSKENDLTIKAYEKSAAIYLQNTIRHEASEKESVEAKNAKLYEFIKDSFSPLPVHARILEIGSADGKVAKYLYGLGYDVTASDVAESFREAIKKEELNTIKLNILEDSINSIYDGVLCWRVFVHFTNGDASIAIKKIYDALEYGGRFVFNAMNIELHDAESEWLDFDGDYHMGVERFFHYFSEEYMLKTVKDTGFNVVSFHKEGGKDNNKWLVFVLEK